MYVCIISVTCIIVCVCGSVRVLKLRPIVPSNYQTKHIGHLILFNGGDKGPLKLLDPYMCNSTYCRENNQYWCHPPPSLPLSPQPSFLAPLFCCFNLAKKGAAVCCSSNKCTLCGPGRWTLMNAGLKCGQTKCSINFITPWGGSNWTRFHNFPDHGV